MWARSIEAACAWFDLCTHNGITLNPKKFQFAQDTVDFAELSITPTNVCAQGFWMILILNDTDTQRTVLQLPL